MDNSGRLPSFKPPRDLTLSRGGSSQRPNRRYTPNIPPPRDRGKPSTRANSVENPVAGSSKSIVETDSPLTNSDTDRGNRNKKRGELVQSESIFAQGAGDPTVARRRLATASSSRSHGGGGGGSGSTGRRGAARSQISKVLKKKDEEDGEEEDWIGGTFIDYSDDDEEDTIHPVCLPLSSYFVDKADAFVHQTPLTSTNSAIKPEFPLPKLERNSFAHLVQSTKPDEEKLLLIQLPSRLPVLDKASAEASQNIQSSNNSIPKLESLAENLDSLPEGPIGKIQIMASGRTQFVMGDNVFEIQKGANISFLQELMSLDLEDKKLVKLGPVTNKFIITPKMDMLVKPPI